MSKKRTDIFGRFILYTNISIWSLVFLVPVGAYFLTGDVAYLSPIHFFLAGAVGLAQVYVTKLFRKRFQRYWERVKYSLYRLGERLQTIKSYRDVKLFRREKQQLLKPLLEEETFSLLGESLNHLLDEIADIFEVKLFKEELIRRLTTTLSTEKLSQILASNLLREFSLSGVAVYLKSFEGDIYELKTNKGFDNIKEVLGEGFVEKVSSTGKTLSVENLDMGIDLGLCSVKARRIYVHPLVPRRGKPLGVIFLGTTAAPTPDFERRLEHFFSEIEPTLSLLFENAYEHEKSVVFSNYDYLTGALNRRAGLKILKGLLQKALTEGNNLCIFTIDIDHFKRINDTYGHDIGDYILKRTVELIRSSIREEDLVIRWGGEEFLVVLTDIPSQKAVEIAERIRKHIEQTALQLPNGSKLNITVSIGVACTAKENTYVFEELFKIADQRLYRAKESGRNRVVAS